jgi:hypothetical protein
MTKEIPKVGYLKYQGKAVQEGIIDAKIAGEALISLNNTLSRTISVRYPFLSNIDLPTPVVIQKGSWEALIPDSIEAWIKTGIGVTSITYLTTAVKKLAENGFKDKKISDLFRGALEGLLWLVRLAKHLGTSAKKKFENLTWRNGNEEVGIKNEKNKIFWIPVWVIDVYEHTSENLLIGMIKAVEDERVLSIGVKINDDFEEVEVVKSEKSFFIVDTDVLFPELKHNQQVSLEGYVTRGTETSNSIGFRYMDHILTCYPSSGNIKRFKNNLFSRCNIVGTISRLDKFGGTNDPKPKIIFDDLTAIDTKQVELPLDSKEEETPVGGGGSLETRSHP